MSLVARAISRRRGWYDDRRRLRSSANILLTNLVTRGVIRGYWRGTKKGASFLTYKMAACRVLYELRKRET